MLQDGVLQRPTEYFRNLRKHRNGRQSTRCDWMEYYNGRQSAQCDWMEHYNGRQSAQCDWMEHYNGRQNTCHDGRSTLTADRVLNAIRNKFLC